MLSRRIFLLSTTALAATTFANEAKALSRGNYSTVATTVNNNVVVNFNGSLASPSGYTGAFLNIAKWIQPYSTQSGWPNLMSGTGEYPNGTFTSTTTGSVPIDPTYYGHYLISWSGTGSLVTGGSNPTIIYSGSSFVTGGSSGEVGGNVAITGTNASVEIAFGLMFKSVQRDSNNLIQFTTTFNNRAGNFPTSGTTMIFNNTSLPSGPNPDGSWNIIRASADFNNISLVGSVSTSTPTINTSGTPGVNTEGIYSTSTSSSFLTGTYSGFSNLMWIRKGDLTDYNAGKLVTPETVAAFAGTKAAYLRFMDLIQTQNIQLPSSAHRVLSTDFSWSFNVSKFAYWGGVMTNTSDTFTVPTNPSASPASGAYVDGEIVIAQVPSSGHNTTSTPVMGITGRTGTAPIFSSSMNLLNMFLTGSVPNIGSVINFTFNGAGLSSFAFSYTTSNSGPGGKADNSFANIAVNIRAALQANTTFTNAGWWCQNPNLPNSAKITGGAWNDSLAAFYYNPNVNSSGSFQQNAGATISATDASGAMTLTFGNMPFGGSLSYMSDDTICAFTYSAILGGWVCSPGALDSYPGGRATAILGGGPPLEWCAELCARAGAGMWLNIGVLDSATSIYNKVLTLAQLTYNGQPAVKTLAVEWGNETWNSTEALWTPTQTTAACLGFNINADAGDYSSHGLRTFQTAKQAVQAWSDAGRARSQLKMVNAYQFVAPNGQSAAPTSTTLKYRFKGTSLTLSNTTLQTIGGLGATAINLNMSASPNRPIDWCDWISPATYWSGAQDAFNINGQTWNGTDVSPSGDYNGLLLAGYNYAYGTSTQQTAALDFLSNIASTSGDLYNGTVDSVNVNGTLISSWVVGGSDAFAAYYFGLSALLSTIDADRPSSSSSNGFAQSVVGVGCYEGGWQMGPSSSGQIASTLTNLGYTNGYSSSLPGAAVGGPTGSSDTAALASTNIYNLLIAWKNDTRAFNLVTKQFNQFKAAAQNSNANRDAFAAWYGFTGPSNIWSLYPGIITQGSPFQAYSAIANWH